MKKKILQKIIGLSAILIMMLCIYGFMISRIGFSIILTVIFSLCLILVMINYISPKYFDKGIDSFFEYRWLIYLIIFIPCILFKIHGSSIGEFNNIFSEKMDSDIKTTLLGHSRGIRSDEFTVLTPYYISQTYNNFSKYSSMMSISPQNMIIGYNSPVKDITSLCKPLLWGYILFGKDIGLSWYWCMKWILLFAFALECSYIFTKSKKLSVVGGLLVVLGPSTQWWFAPHMPDVILWMMAILSIVYYYLTTEKNWLKNIFTVILPFIITEFIIALFPSFQVSLGIFMVVTLVLLIIRDKISLTKPKSQWIRHSVIIVGTLLLASYFVLSNKEALLAVMNSAYPGKRISTGGEEGFSSIFTSLVTIFLPYKDITFLNNCEVSTYIHFGFFITLLFPVFLKIMKKKNDKNLIIGIGMLVILFIYAFFMIIGFPEILAKITFFSYINRMKMIVGFISVFYTIWGIQQILKYKKEINPIYYIISCLIYCGIQITFITAELKTYFNEYIFVLEIIAFLVILLALYFNYEQVSISCLLGILLFASLTINPVVRGTSDLYNHPSAQYIGSVVKKDSESYWIGYNNIVLQSYVLANGGKTINAVNFYIDEKKWNIIDPDHKYEEIYNRYAHTILTINADDITEISNPQSDVIKLTLPLNKLHELNVKYVLSKEELNISNDKYYLEQIYKDSDCFIYKLKSISI
ncbi:MAG: hypothetical protein IKE63_02960 [Bacilli bacterium]|nr:hypothetical protein [Bacilli bacterium]